MSALHVIELQRAKLRIASQECYFICDALMMDDESETWSPAARQVKDVIDVALDGIWNVSAWLSVKGIRTGGNYSPEMRAYRLLWIDQMIEYWRDK